MAEPIISFKKLNITFGENVVINNIDLDIRQGETLAVLGPSGSGKSTILRAMIGLLQPTAGEIFVQGEQVSSLDEDGWNKLRQKMGMVFQYSALFDFLTVGENVAFGLRQHTDKSESEIQGIVDEMLELVGLPQSKEQYPAELSGGMKKRVGIARAIVLNPKYLFCDEPNSGLDPRTSIVIDDLIIEITKEYNMTTIINTHDMNSVMEIGEKIVFLFKGQKDWEGNSSEILSATDENLNAFIFASDFLREARDALKEKKGIL